MNASRRLRDDERDLWEGVTQSVVPLPRRREADPKSSSGATATKASPKSKPASAPAVQVRPAAPPPSLAPLGRRMKQRLARGAEAIDGRLDLHGHTQEEAHAALLRFLRGAQGRGAKNVLVITGKGGRTAGRGVLKRQVPQWLRLPVFRGLIVGFEDAHVGHGGEGALYVRVRRAK